MRKIFWLVAVCWISVLSLNTRAAEARIYKVLPHYLDLQGRHTPAPSLYERDAYQAHLRLHPAERSALRFDVQWKAPRSAATKLKLRLELLGRGEKESGKPIVLEALVERRKWFSQWSALQVEGEDYRNLGDLMAWRATLWDGAVQIAEQKSFLW